MPAANVAVLRRDPGGGRLTTSGAYHSIWNLGLMKHMECREPDGIP